MSHSLVESLEAYLRAIGARFRPDTVATYRNQVKSFIRFLGKRHPDVESWKDVERAHAEEWLLDLASGAHPLSSNSRRNYILGVRLFVRWLSGSRGEEAPQETILTSRDLPPQDKLLPKALSPESDRTLIRHLRRDSSLQGMALLLMRWTGTRIGELLRLELDCLESVGKERWAMRIPLGKLHNERVIPVDREVADLIGAIHHATGKSHTNARDGRSIPTLLSTSAQRTLSAGRLRTSLRSIAAKAGIVERIWPHRLRHTYATDLLRRGASLPTVMRLLGHTCVTMTLRYTNVTQEDVLSAYFAARSRAGARYRFTETGTRHEPRLDSPEQVAPAIDELARRIRMLAAGQPSKPRRKRLQRIADALARLQKSVGQS